MEIALEGRELVKNEILERTAKTIVSVSEYNDGTIIEYRIEAGEVSVKCNKQLVLQGVQTAKRKKTTLSKFQHKNEYF